MELLKLFLGMKKKMNNGFFFIYYKLLVGFGFGSRHRKFNRRTLNAMDIFTGKDFIEYYKNEKRT